MPWIKIETEYVSDAPEGKVTLADLFDGRSQGGGVRRPVHLRMLPRRLLIFPQGLAPA